MSDTFYIFGDFNMDISRDFCRWINSKQEDGRKSLYVYINSTGGCSFSLQAMLDAMSLSKHTIYTVGTGALMSCGLELFIAGDYRLLYEGATPLAHQFSWGTSGKYHELLADTGQFTIEYDRQVQFYVLHSKLTATQVKKILLKESDCFITAKEMMKYGMADELIPVPDRKQLKKRKKNGKKK